MTSDWSNPFHDLRQLAIRDRLPVSTSFLSSEIGVDTWSGSSSLMIRFRFAFLLRTVSESLLRSGLRSNRRLVRFRSFFSRASFSCLTFCAHERAGNRIKLHQALPGLAFKIKTSKPVAGPPRVRLAEMPHSHQIDHVAMYSSANKHVFHSHQKKKSCHFLSCTQHNSWAWPLVFYLPFSRWTLSFWFPEHTFRSMWCRRWQNWPLHCSPPFSRHRQSEEYCGSYRFERAQDWWCILSLS